MRSQVASEAIRRRAILDKLKNFKIEEPNEVKHYFVWLAANKKKNLYCREYKLHGATSIMQFICNLCNFRKGWNL